MDTDFPNNCSRSRIHVPGRREKSQNNTKKIVFGSIFGFGNRDRFLNVSLTEIVLRGPKTGSPGGPIFGTKNWPQKGKKTDPKSIPNLVSELLKFDIRNNAQATKSAIPETSPTMNKNTRCAEPSFLWNRVLQVCR